MLQYVANVTVHSASAITVINTAKQLTNDTAWTLIQTQHNEQHTNNTTNIGDDSMGAIAPTAKKLWGRRPQVAPQKFCYVRFLKR